MIGGIHVHTHRVMGGIVIEMSLGTMIYIPSFIKIGSDIQKLMGWGGFTDTQTA
jgi:hypothetical protein